ncbi:MAG: hypothetical protein SPG52_04350 [Candidatus Cryptobacteroides sp.]|nr:hypothetical protein [Candidatus Cryptobacteroides sp.]
MKSVKFSALVAVAVIAASCAKEGTHSVDESDKVALEPMCIEASDESQTKTVLDGKSVNWTDGDEIAVYSNIDYTTGYRFASTDINGSNSATFSGKVPAGTESFFAVYPPERVVSVNEKGVTVNIPANQNPAAGTFAEEHNITVAQGTKTPGEPSVGPITFNNVCSYVKFTVPAYVSDVNKVTITSGNAIAGDFSTASSSIVSNGTNSISMSGSFGAGKTFIFVIAPGTVSNFRIDITADNGNWTRTVSKGFTATAGVPTNLKTIDFKQVALTATASHVYDGETLVGTDLSVNLGLDGFLKYASNLMFYVKKDGATVRSYSSGTVANSTVSFASTDYPDYPYLPKGDYTIEGSYSRPDGSTQTISGTFTVPAPTFTVNAPLATTNYDTYKDPTLKDAAAAANAQDGSTIYGVAENGVSISEDILTKYASLIGGYSFTIDGNTATPGDNANQSYAAHDVVATYVFDGVSKSSTAHTCYVTGLPFLKALPTEKTWPVYGNIENWSYSTTDGKGIFYNTGGYIQKNFYIPASAGDTGVAVRINHYGKGRKGSLVDATTFNIYAGNTPVYKYKYTSTDGTGEKKTANIDTNLTNTNYWVKCSSSYVWGTSTYAMTFNIEVLYR